MLMSFRTKRHLAILFVALTISFNGAIAVDFNNLDNEVATGQETVHGDLNMDPSMDGPITNEEYDREDEGYDGDSTGTMDFPDTKIQSDEENNGTPKLRGAHASSWDDDDENEPEWSGFGESHEDDDFNSEEEKPFNPEVMHNEEYSQEEEKFFNPEVMDDEEYSIEEEKPFTPEIMHNEGMGDKSSESTDTNGWWEGLPDDLDDDGEAINTDLFVDVPVEDTDNELSGEFNHRYLHDVEDDSVREDDSIDDDSSSNASEEDDSSSDSASFDEEESMSSEDSSDDSLEPEVNAL